MGSILWLPVVFATSSLYLYYLSTQLPAIQTKGPAVNSTALIFPSNLEELQSLALLLKHYRTNHMNYIVLLYSSAYLFKQTFAIPGSVFLNLLGGALFGQWMGFFLTCLLSASGASACFLLAKICGRSYIQRYFPDQLSKVQDKIEENSDSLFFFLMFLRLFPMTPNWFLNMASPICGVPLHLFFLSVFFGLMPYNFISVQTGCLLSSLKSIDDVFSAWTMFKLFSMATAALVPGLIIKKYHVHRSNQKKEKEYEEKVAKLKAEIEHLEKLEAKVTGEGTKPAAEDSLGKQDEHKVTSGVEDVKRDLLKGKPLENEKEKKELLLTDVSAADNMGKIKTQPVDEGVGVKDLSDEMVKDPSLLHEQKGEDLVKSDQSTETFKEIDKLSIAPQNETSLPNMGAESKTETGVKDLGEMEKSPDANETLSEQAKVTKDEGNKIVMQKDDKDITPNELEVTGVSKDAHNRDIPGPTAPEAPSKAEILSVQKPEVGRAEEQRESECILPEKTVDESATTNEVKESAQLKEATMTGQEEKQLLTEAFVKDLVQNVIKEAIVKVKADGKDNESDSLVETAKAAIAKGENTEGKEEVSAQPDASSDAQTSFDKIKAENEEIKAKETFQGLVEEKEEASQGNLKQAIVVTAETMEEETDDILFEDSPDEWEDEYEEGSVDEFSDQYELEMGEDNDDHSSKTH